MSCRASGYVEATDIRVASRVAGRVLALVWKASG
jgi:hypothetical protein